MSGLLPALALALLQAPPVFEAGVETVYVDVSVTEGDRPRTSLTSADFEVYDDGGRQDTRLVDVGTFPLRVVMVFDLSASLDARELAQLGAAGQAFAQGLRDDDEIAIVGFSHTVRLVSRPSADRAVIRSALATLRPGGQTALYDAVQAGLVLAGGPRRSLLVVFTDGADNSSFLRAEDVVATATAGDTLVHVVSLTEPRATRLEQGGRPDAPQSLSNNTSPLDEATDAHARALERLVDVGGGRVWNAASSHELQSRFLQVLEAVRGRYVLAFEPTARDGREHRLEVKVRGGGKVRARTRYRSTSPP